MKRTSSLILLLLVCFSNAQAIGEDTTSLHKAVEERLSPLLFWGKQVFGNPSLQPYAWHHNLTDIRLGCRFRDEDDPLVMQLGDGSAAGNFTARSYLHPDSVTTLWGHAGYSYGRVNAVFLNSTSDFPLLYPYIMADTVGGDMDTETYAFGGGYARTSGRISWGVYGTYRASIEYRKVDPRPRNVTSDLKISGGLSWQLGTGYRIAAKLDGRIYRQRNSIRFLSDLGATRIFQMLGMGMYQTRFSGSTSSIQFDGWGCGGGLDLVPSGDRGLYVSAGMDHFAVKRILLQKQNLPLTRLKENACRLTFGWKDSGLTREKALELQVGYTDRKGIESVYGDSGNSNYPKINDMEMYGNRRVSAVLKAMSGWRCSARTSLHAAVRGSFRHFKSTYASPRLSLETAKAGGGAELTYTASLKGSVLQVLAEGDYYVNVTDKLDIALLSSGPFFSACMERQFESLRQDFFHHGIGLHWIFPLKDRLMLAFDGKWNHICQENHNRSNLLEFGCSLSF